VAYPGILFGGGGVQTIQGRGGERRGGEGEGGEREREKFLQSHGKETFPLCNLVNSCHTVVYPGIMFGGGGGSTNSVEDRGQRTDRT
jgi:hypothetical protein